MTCRALAGLFGLALLFVWPTPSTIQADSSGARSADQADATAAPTPQKQRRKKKRRKKKRRKKKRRGRRRGNTKAYRVMRDGWHAPAAPEDFPQVPEGALPPLVIRTLGIDEPFVMPVLDEDGAMDEASLEVASHALAKKGVRPRPVHPRLLSLLYRAQRHFQVPYLRVISGIRRSRRRSRHYHGLAADVVLPGVADKDAASFFRAQGFVGVGVYLRSGFVHVDVREKSYFWVDRSPRGRRWKPRQVRAAEAVAADEAARLRGEPEFVAPKALKRALRRRAARRAKKRRKSRKKKTRAKKKA